MQIKIEKLPKATYKFQIEFSPEAILRVKRTVLNQLAQKTRIPGFREGKVPLDLVEKNIDKNFMKREVLNNLFSEAYSRIIKEHHLKPIVTPRFKVDQWKEYETLKFDITLAEKPDIKVGDYLQILKEKQKKVTADDVLATLLKVTEAELSDLLIEDEVDRMLSNLLDQVTRIGLTIEKYLKSRNKTSEQLRQEYTQKAKESLITQLALQELIEKEKIEVSNDEIKESIRANPDEESRKQLAKEENKWYIKTILARQKLLSRIIEQVGGKDAVT